MHNPLHPPQQWQAPHLIRLSTRETRSGLPYIYEGVYTYTTPTSGGGVISYPVFYGPTTTTGTCTCPGS